MKNDGSKLDDLDAYLDSSDFGLRTTDFGKMITPEERDFTKRAIQYHRSQELQTYKQLADAATQFFSGVGLGTASLPIVAALKLSAYIFLRGVGKSAGEAGNISSRWVSNYFDGIISTAEFTGKVSGDTIAGLVSMATGVQLPEENDGLPSNDTPNVQTAFSNHIPDDDSAYALSYSLIFEQIKKQNKLNMLNSVETDARSIAGVHSQAERKKLLFALISKAEKSLEVMPIESAFICLRSYVASHNPKKLDKFRGCDVVDVDSSLNQASDLVRLWMASHLSVPITEKSADNRTRWKNITLSQIDSNLEDAIRIVADQHEYNDNQAIAKITCGNCGFEGEVEFGEKYEGQLTVARKARILRLVRNGRPGNSQFVSDGEAVCPECNFLNQFAAYYSRPSPPGPIEKYFPNMS